jgi:riboflavin synthase
MFTGIIEALGRVALLERNSEGGRVEVRLMNDPGRPLHPGQSIAVNGCCLTVAEIHDRGFAAALSLETLRRTSFAELEVGATVNLEWPLRAGDELGGHFVLGHVDGVGRIEELRREGTGWWLTVQLPEGTARLVALKGSLAVDGISLTVAELKHTRAGFAIIPFTYTHTNLHTRQPGDLVNIECDVLARYLARLVDTATPGLPSTDR